MISSDAPLADTLMSIADPTEERVAVLLTHELVTLLSDQLYQSPTKAFEELVVNAYDADATECRIFVPEPSERDTFVVVYDDGTGMDRDGLKDLWQVGHSNKRSEEIARRARRKQIGKFGIGKLATYAVANEVTYLTRKGEEVLMVTLDFRRFARKPEGAIGKAPEEAITKVELDVGRIANPVSLLDTSIFRGACESVQLDPQGLFTSDTGSWTMVILEAPRPKMKKMPIRRLRWVLSTAMPLKDDFRLFLNGRQIESSKVDFDPLVQFDITELPLRRMESLARTTGEDWTVSGKALVSNSFPSGISGSALVTRQSLYAGKSDDLGRSHGFFIRVRDRLVNEENSLLGLKPLSFETFNFFRADVQADDLDYDVTAPREGLGESERREKLQQVLAAIFYEARDRQKKLLDQEEAADGRKRDGERNYVNPRLVERPLADILSRRAWDKAGTEPDESWFYVQLDPNADLRELIQSLYIRRPLQYTYKYAGDGRSSRLVKFDPVTSTFHINADHDLAKAHFRDGRSQVLLEDLVTAEALLEVYLREHDVPSHTIGEVLEKRDALLRSLAKDHPYSLASLSSDLVDSANQEYDLEVAVVAAARSLGFVAKHISGSGEPDGLAKFNDYRSKAKKITLEAKSSGSIPSLSQLDFAGIQEHMTKSSADGCLLVAPGYPGGTADSSAVANRAREGKISCWTIRHLARVVEAAESRHITAKHVLDIVLEQFAPNDVSEAVDLLLREPTWAIRDLYRVILNALRSLEPRLLDAPRTVDMVASEVSHDPRFRGVEKREIEEAIRNLANASQGSMDVADGRIIMVYGSVDEIERRVSGLTGHPGEPRRMGTFRDIFRPEPESSDS